MTIPTWEQYMKYCILLTRLTVFAFKESTVANAVSSQTPDAKPGLCHSEDANEKFGILNAS